MGKGQGEKGTGNTGWGAVFPVCILLEMQSSMLLMPEFHDAMPPNLPLSLRGSPYSQNQVGSMLCCKLFRNFKQVK